MVDFAEVADRVWVGRYDWFDVNVTVVAGDHGALVVDTHGSAAAATQVVADLRRLGVGGTLGDLVGVVNTHWHFDHTFGNRTVVDAFGSVPVTAHEDAAAELRESAGDVRRRYAADLDDPHRDAVLATTVLVPDDVFSSARVIDLGDRVAELVHPGRGHTAGDLVVRLPDADVVLAGDLVEESAPPALGADCWPMEWPLTLDLVIGLLTPATVVVPGHGAPVDRGFVERQHDDLGVVAETIRHLAEQGVPAEDALAAADSWPFPVEHLGDAVRRGYQHLPRSQKRLPLI